MELAFTIVNTAYNASINIMNDTTLISWYKSRTISLCFMLKMFFKRKTKLRKRSLPVIYKLLSIRYKLYKHIFILLSKHSIMGQNVFHCDYACKPCQNICLKFHC